MVAQAAPTISPEEAHAIGVEAYVYFYPLITMDVTRRQLTNMKPDSGLGGPMNRFANVPAFPTADMKVVVRPNFDTLYSSAWLDLTKEPVVVSVPDTGGRYYLLPMLDMWTDVFASPGWRTTGTGAGHFLITPPGWRPDLRDRFIDEFKLPKDTQRIDAPTPYVWIIGRTKTDGPADYDAVHKVQAGYSITPLSEWGKTPKPVEFKPDPTVDMTTPPKEEVDTMPAVVYFAYAAELMKTIPAHLTDQAMLARLKRIGFEPGKSFDLYKIDADIRDALVSAPTDGQALMKWKVNSLAAVVNGWSMNTNSMGVYGDYYLKRAIVSQLGLGANQPEDAIYPINLADSAGQPLNGDNDYTIHFDKDQIPPADAFWSVTLYDAHGLPGGEQPQPLRGQQLDAVQIQRRRLARPLFPERLARRRQGMELAAGAEGAVQPDHAALRTEVGRAYRQVEPATSHSGAGKSWPHDTVGTLRTEEPGTAPAA